MMANTGDPLNFPISPHTQDKVTRAKVIAAIYKVPYYKKLKLNDLIPAIRENMLLVRQCGACSNASHFTHCG